MDSQRGACRETRPGHQHPVHQGKPTCPLLTLTRVQSPLPWQCPPSGRSGHGRGTSLPSPTAHTLSPGSKWGDYRLQPRLGHEGIGLSGPHLPHKGQVPGEGALIQGVVFREEDPWALGKEAGESQSSQLGRARRWGLGRGQQEERRQASTRVLSPVTPPRTVPRWDASPWPAKP